MKIVILDQGTINPGDLSWERLGKFADLEIYDRTAQKDVIKRAGDADICLTSKLMITKDIMENLGKLRYIGVLATGYNNVDCKAAEELGIAVTNIPAYSTEAVAQHTFALMLEAASHVGLHNTSVKNGDWFKSKDFCYWNRPISLLSGKSLGIIGYGSIGRKVADLAVAFGMKVNIYSRSRETCMKSDYISLHCPLTGENNGFVNKEFISQMKDGAVLINTARGALVNEDDLAEALLSGKLSAAALDVLGTEPPKPDNPLIGIKNCIITPHIAWSPKEMRQRIVDVCCDNIESFLSGGMLNRV